MSISKTILTSSPIGHKFIYQYPRFGNAKYRKDDLKHWRTQAHKIKPTTKGVRWDNSVYYLWFEYLRRHDGYREYCTTKRGPYKKLYTDFGDVHAYADDFRQWFYDIGFDLFIEAPLPARIVISDDCNSLTTTDGFDANADYVFAAIPVGNSRKHLLREYKKVITQIKDQRKRDGLDGKSTAKYPVHRIPYIHNLKLNLQVWDLRQSGMKSPDVYETVFARITDAQLKKRGYRDDDIKRFQRIRTQQYHNVINRHYRSARLLIENVADGNFPCTDE